MDKSIKQIADDLSIDKQRVYRYIKRSCIREAHQLNGVLYYDELAQTAIRQGLMDACTSAEVHQEHDSSTRDALVDLLRNELETKNEQIRQLNNQIQELHTRLAEQTAAQLETQKLLQGSQALHAGTLRSLPTSPPQTVPQPLTRKRPQPPKPSFWNYLDNLLGSK